MLRLACILSLLPALAGAESLVATRTIRALSVIGPQDIALSDERVEGALSEPSQVIGMEARAVIYAGRAIRAGDVAPAALVLRNQRVVLNWQKGGLVIAAEGRALDRGAAGEAVRAINLGSRTTVSGIVAPDGSISVEGAIASRREKF